MKTIKVIVLIFTIVCISVAVYKSHAQNATISSQWSEVDKWLEWKMSTDLTEEQRVVLEYLKNATEIFNEAFDTECVYPNSRYGYPNIEEAIKIVQLAISKLENMPSPEECTRYKELCIDNLKYILKYHQLRLEYGDGTEEFNKKHHEYELAFSESELGPKKFSEYFAVMKKIGLFDNMEKEMKALGFN